MKSASIQIRRRGASHESGVALVISLILLVVMTLLAVGAMRSSNLEERIAGNAQDSNVALQAAEAALRDGEKLLQQPQLPAAGNPGIYGEPDPEAEPRWKTVDWKSNTQVIAYGGFTDAPSSLKKATAGYYVEELPRVVGVGESLAADTPVDDLSYYRVTARGVGVAGQAQAVLQSVFKR